MNPATFVFLIQAVYMNKKILQLAIPSIISNITVPLLGLIDVAIVGHLGSVSYIGAIAVGGMLFNMIYWIFGFLRMGTGGMTAQAYGKRDLPEVVRILLRAIGVGFLISLGLWILQYPLLRGAFALIDATEEVKRWASLYFNICIWGAPAVLGLYGFSGWFIGMQNSRFPMFVAITQNIVNISASLCFVFGLGMKVEGVALGTLIAQYAGFFMAFILWLKYYGRLKVYIRCGHNTNARHMGTWDGAAMRRFFSLNRDIFFRTLCLVAVTTFFTSTGARQGDVILAVNTLLMQLFTLFSYIMDGFAYAGEALAGRYIGAGNRRSLHGCIRLIFRWGIGLSLSFTILYALGGRDFLGLLTSDGSVLEASGDYFYWVLAVPLCGFSAFLWDGIFIGATDTRRMLYAMLVASGAFFGIYYGFYPSFGNHALWMAFLGYLSLRGIVQWMLWRY